MQLPQTTDAAHHRSNTPKDIVSRDYTKALDHRTFDQVRCEWHSYKYTAEGRARHVSSMHEHSERVQACNRKGISKSSFSLPFTVVGLGGMTIESCAAPVVAIDDTDSATSDGAASRCRKPPSSGTLVGLNVVTFKLNSIADGEWLLLSSLSSRAFFTSVPAGITVGDWCHCGFATDSKVSAVVLGCVCCE
jgi:hypothetical protein